MKKLLVILTDPLKIFHEKGEVKPRYYNPGNAFSEVHFISPASDEIEPEKVQCLVGDNAKLTIHPVGLLPYYTGILPFGHLATLIKNIRPDLIRAYHPGVAGSLAVLWGRRLEIPSVISIHSDLDDQRRYEKRLIHQARKALEHYSLRRATQVICVSRYLEAYAKKYGAKRVAVIYNRVYTEDFTHDDNCAGLAVHDAGGITVLSVGRLVSPKDQECLIRATQGLNMTLILIGDGILRASLQHLVDNLNMKEQVRFIKAVPHAEIPSYYSAADIFAIATHYEGFCIPVLEAMAAGLPVVASRIGPIEEILGDAGFLVENRPKAFAEILIQLGKDPALRLEMGKRARRRALSLDGHVSEEEEKDLCQSLCLQGSSIPGQS